MATPSSGNEGPQDPTRGFQAKARLAQALKTANQVILRRRRPLAPIGAAAAGPVVTSVQEKHVLQKDFLNIIIGSSVVEAVVTRDTDGGMRFYVPAGDLAQRLLNFLDSGNIPDGPGVIWYDGANFQYASSPGVAGTLKTDGTNIFWA